MDEGGRTANLAREDRGGNHLMTVRPDNRLADSPMVPVACRRCGASVLARKSSWNQTSVQWSAQASAQCLERQDAEQLAVTGMACSSRVPRCGIRYQWPPGRVHCQSLTRLSASRAKAQACAPPSTRISVPVMNEPSSEATIAMTEATELGSPRISLSRPCSNGVCFAHRPRS